MNCQTEGGRTPRTPAEAGRTPRRRRRGGGNCDEEAATSVTESSAAEVSPRKTGRGREAAGAGELQPRVQRRLLTSGEEDAAASAVSGSRRESKASPEIFSGHSFVLTSSRDTRLPLTEPESADTDSEAGDRGGARVPEPRWLLP